MDKLKLPDDQIEALEQIAGYLSTVSHARDRAVREEGEIVGYWQCSDWIEGLLDIGVECQRLAAQLRNELEGRG